MSWPCFLVEPTGRDRVALRRYSFRERDCPNNHGYHDAQNPIGVLPGAARHDHPDHDDPRWPKKCAGCPYMFTPEDNWQVFALELYRAPDGREFVLREAPAGAMWRATWLEDAPNFRGQDGKSFVVKLPGAHEWCIDGPSKDGGRWTRTGEAPRFTVSPSILVPDYHGHLIDGVLTDPC